MNEKEKLFLEKVMNKLSRKAVQKLSKLNLDTESEKIFKQMQELQTVLGNSKIEGAEEELEARAKLEEHQVEKIIQLNELMRDEISRTEAAIAQLGSPISKKKQSEVTLDKYNRWLASSKLPETVDVVELVDTHAANVKRRDEISKMEDLVKKWRGLPPDKQEAKYELQKLQQEMAKMAEEGERRLEREMSDWIASSSKK